MKNKLGEMESWGGGGGGFLENNKLGKERRQLRQEDESLLPQPEGSVQ